MWRIRNFLLRALHAHVRAHVKLQLSPSLLLLSLSWTGRRRYEQVSGKRIISYLLKMEQREHNEPETFNGHNITKRESELARERKKERNEIGPTSENWILLLPSKKESSSKQASDCLAKMIYTESSSERRTNERMKKKIRTNKKYQWQIRWCMWSSKWLGKAFASKCKNWNWMRKKRKIYITHTKRERERKTTNNNRRTA